MSDPNRPPDLVQYGRPLRKRYRTPVAQPPGTGAPAVGPLDAPLPPDGAATIIRAPRPEGLSPAAERPAYEPREPRERESRERRPSRERREPDAEDGQLKELVAFMARGLVDHPDDVSVEIVEAGDDASFELRVHPDDTGHVIGRQGRTARAMRLCLGAAASRIGRRAGLEIAD
jgi:hypothetical protein